jgi:hypothetical protein
MSDTSRRVLLSCFTLLVVMALFLCLFITGAVLLIIL